MSTSDGVPVAAGGGDQAAGALGVGVDRPGPLSVVLGTSGVVFAALDAFAADAEARVHAFCHAVPGRLARDGRDALRRRELCAGCGTRSRPASVTTRSSPRPRSGRRGPRGCCSLRTSRASARRTPTPTRAARSPASAFATIAARSSARCSRASLRAARLARPDRRARRGFGELGRVSGGGARSTEWLQIVATVLELPLERVAVDEGAAFGAAILGGVAAGTWDDVHAAVAATVRPRERIEPVPEWVEVYRERRERFRAIVSGAAGDPVGRRGATAVPGRGGAARTAGLPCQTRATRAPGARTRPRRGASFRRRAGRRAGRRDARTTARRGSPRRRAPRARAGRRSRRGAAPGRRPSVAASSASSSAHPHLADRERDAEAHRRRVARARVAVRRRARP